MQLTVKILQGGECQLEVSENTTVSMLKTLVESKLHVPRAAQKLVFRGKPLQDGDTMTAARLTDGAKVFLVTAKPTATAPATASASSSAATSATTPASTSASAPSSAPATAPASAPAAAPAAAPAQTKPTPPAAADPWAPLRALAERCLGKSDADRFLVEFRKRFELRLSSMSMDDIQKFCASDMTEF